MPGGDFVEGDTNGDGVVDLVDLNNVRNNFGGVGLGDANGDGAVDLEDLNVVRNNFGGGGAPIASPTRSTPANRRQDERERRFDLVFASLAGPRESRSSLDGDWDFVSIPSRQWKVAR